MEKIERILVPVDGSEAANRALETGAHLAHRCQVPFKISYVVPLTAESIMGLANLDKEVVEETGRKWGEEVLTKAREHLGNRAPDDIEDVVLIGDAAIEIINYLENHPGTLVVMGRRGLSPIKHLVMGSVSDKVVRHGGGSVMVVG